MARPYYLSSFAASQPMTSGNSNFTSHFDTPLKSSQDLPLVSSQKHFQGVFHSSLNSFGANSSATSSSQVEKSANYQHISNSVSSGLQGIKRFPSFGASSGNASSQQITDLSSRLETYHRDVLATLSQYKSDVLCMIKEFSPSFEKSVLSSLNSFMADMFSKAQDSKAANEYSNFQSDQQELKESVREVVEKAVGDFVKIQTESIEQEFTSLKDILYRIDSKQTGENSATKINAVLETKFDELEIAMGKHSTSILEKFKLEYMAELPNIIAKLESLEKRLYIYENVGQFPFDTDLKKGGIKPSVKRQPRRKQVKKSDLSAIGTPPLQVNVDENIPTKAISTRRKKQTPRKSSNANAIHEVGTTLRKNQSCEEPDDTGITKVQKKQNRRGAKRTAKTKKPIDMPGKDKEAKSKTVRRKKALSHKPSWSSSYGNSSQEIVRPLTERNMSFQLKAETIPDSQMPISELFGGILTD